MNLLGIRKAQDVDGIPYEVADIKRTGAILPASVRLDAIFGSDENLRTWLLAVPEEKVDEYLCVIIEQWEHPADVAFAIEQPSVTEAVQAEIANDDKWLESSIDAQPDPIVKMFNRIVNPYLLGSVRLGKSTDKTVDVSKYFNGYKARASKTWAERHLNIPAISDETANRIAEYDDGMDDAIIGSLP